MTAVGGVAERYIADAAARCSLTRPIRVVCACGNGTAGAFAPDALKRMGAEVIPMDCELDWSFPKYNPNPEKTTRVLSAMTRAVREHGADLALGFDGDGDRCGVVDDEGEEIFADKIGLILARDLAPRYPGAKFVVDVKSTGLYATDPVLKAAGASTTYWKTGHSYIKRKTAEIGALAGFEKSGHFFFNAPLGRGYDDGLVAAAAILSVLDRHPEQKLSDLKKVARRSPAFTSLDHVAALRRRAESTTVVQRVVVKPYQALSAAGGSILGRKITDVNTVNGARVTLEDASWVLVRASSNKPELVVVVESTRSEDDMRALFREEVKPRLAKEAGVGAYNQEV